MNLLARHHRRWIAYLPWLGMLALVAGCAPTSDVQQVANEQFEVRSMVASNQQAIQGLDNRLRRVEDQIQRMEHGGTPSSGKLQKQVNHLQNELADLQTRLHLPPTATANNSGTPAPGSVPPGPMPPGYTPPGSLPPGSPAPGSTPPEVSSAENGETPPNQGNTAGEGTETPTPGQKLAAVPPSETSMPAATSPNRWRRELDHQLAVAGNSGGSAERIYRSGLESMKKGKYADAIEHFSTLSRKYPHSSLNEPAEYFAANAYYQQGKFERAILQFNDVSMRFPKGRFASQALLREAQAFLKINDKIDARLTLQKLVNEYAGTPEAQAANALMQNVN